MPDFLDLKRREIDERIAELAPLVAEYTALERAVRALDGVGQRPGGSRPVGGNTRRRRVARRAVRNSVVGVTLAAGKPRARPTGPRPGRRKGSGRRAAEALTHIRAQPGITIPELAAKMGIKANYLYRVLPALHKEGKISKRSGGWHARESAPASV